MCKTHVRHGNGICFRHEGQCFHAVTGPQGIGSEHRIGTPYDIASDSVQQRFRQCRKT